MTTTRPIGRVLCSTPNFPRWEGDAVPNYVLHLASDLQDLGWTVDVLAPHAPGAARTEQLAGVHVERFRYAWPTQAQTVCYGSGTLVNLDHDGPSRRKVPLLVGAQLLALARRLSSRRYDILHSHWALPQAVTGRLVATATRVPHVVTCHGEEFHVLRDPRLTPFKRFGLYGADAVTVNSTSTETALRRQAPRVRGVHRIPMGVDAGWRDDPYLTKEIRSRSRRGEGPLVLFTGRHVLDKGVEDLLRAVPIMARTMPDVRLLVAGDGRARSHFESMSAELSIMDRVSFVGWVESDDLASYFAAADVFVAPSRPGPAGFVEGQGLTPLEAMIHGTPVVATTSGGYADLIHHERTALAVPERSPDAIAAAVGRIVSEPELADRLIEQGRSFATAQYARSSVASAFSDLFTELVGRAEP